MKLVKNMGNSSEITEVGEIDTSINEMEKVSTGVRGGWQRA